MVPPLFRRPRRTLPLGQALVETAIMLPILLILLLGAVDFGRAFFGWVNLQQAVRNGANFASITPNMNVDERDRYVELIENDLYVDLANRQNSSCVPEDPIPNPTYKTPAGTATTTPVIGDYATLTMQCDFSPLTPLMGLIVGDPLEMRATATFPVREGCINCPTPVPATPPPPPLQCYAVPAMQGLSVAGARAAWTAAGFDVAKFTPLSGQETETVDDVTVIEDDPLSNCSMPAYAIFSSSVEVTTLPDAEPCAAGEEVVPNLAGMTLADARAAWAAALFDAASFQADGGDPSLPSQSRVVASQETTPGTVAGVDCAALATTTVNVITGAPYATPPPTPCRVPNMTNLSRSDGESAWVAAGFLAANFSPNGGQWTILSQSLVGGTFVTCEAQIRVSQNP